MLHATAAGSALLGSAAVAEASPGPGTATPGSSAWSDVIAAPYAEAAILEDPVIDFQQPVCVSEAEQPLARTAWYDGQVRSAFHVSAPLGPAGSHQRSPAADVSNSSACTELHHTSSTPLSLWPPISTQAHGMQASGQQQQAQETSSLQAARLSNPNSPSVQLPPWPSTPMQGGPDGHLPSPFTQPLHQLGKLPSSASKRVSIQPGAGGSHQHTPQKTSRNSLEHVHFSGGAPPYQQPGQPPSADDSGSSKQFLTGRASQENFTSRLSNMFARVSQIGAEHSQDLSGAVHNHSPKPHRNSLLGFLLGPSLPSRHSTESGAAPFSPAGSMGQATRPSRQSGGRHSGAASRTSLDSEAGYMLPKRHSSVMTMLHKALHRFSTGGHEPKRKTGWFSSLQDFREVTYRTSSNEQLDTYLVFPINDKTPYCMKVYKTGAMEAAQVAALRIAINLALRLEHPHLLNIHGNWETEDSLYWVEDYMFGGHAESCKLMRPDRFTEQYMAVHLIQPLLSVLHYLHSHDIIHRSITPDHLLLSRKDGEHMQLSHLMDAVEVSMGPPHERIRYLDYCAPEMLAIKDANETGFIEAVTLEATTPQAEPRISLSGFRASIGDALFGLRPAVQKSNPFPAPQQIPVVPTNNWEWQAGYDEKVDIWQVGCLIHELLCESCPFESGDRLLTAALILWADIQAWPDNLSAECTSFIEACLTKDPTARPSALELLQHPWIVKHVAGEVLPSRAAVAAAKQAQSQQQAEDGSFWGLLMGFFSGRNNAVAPVADSEDAPSDPMTVPPKLSTDSGS